MVSILSFKDIAKIFEEIELRLISSLKRNLKMHKAEEQRYGFEWSAWQAEKLKNMENFRRENLDIMNEYVDIIDDQTRQLMTEQFQEGQQQAQRSAQELSDEPITPIPDKHFFGVNEKKMAKLMEDVTTLEKTAETAALRMTDDIYRQTLNRVQLAMGTGSMTLNEAIDLATKDFLDKGINCIVYADGKRVNIADYVRMALRTTSTRAALQGAAKRFAELGYDTVLVSQYGGCSKTCEPWQGQVYIDDVFTVWEGEKDEFQGKSNYCGEWFWLLSYAVKNGLFHPNCRHTMTQYIHGRTQIPEPIPAEKIKEQRELEQKQRAMERKVRKLKRFAAGTCDPDTAKEYRRKLRQAQHELKVFAEEHNEVLHRDHSREKYYGGGVDKSGKSGIMKSGRNLERKEQNIGAFSTLTVPMQKREILNICRKYSIDTSGITFKIQRSEKLLALPFYGSTDYNNIGRIDLFPSAFSSEEELVKTILHEKCHVLQLKKHGKAYAQQNLDLMEKQAYRFERLFYSLVTKR